jgi:hypothetical protein
MLVLRDDAKREYAYGLPKAYVRFGLPIQPIAATHSANFSAGE